MCHEPKWMIYTLKCTCVSEIYRDGLTHPPPPQRYEHRPSLKRAPYEPRTRHKGAGVATPPRLTSLPSLAGSLDDEVPQHLSQGQLAPRLLAQRQHEAHESQRGLWGARDGGYARGGLCHDARRLLEVEQVKL